MNIDQEKAIVGSLPSLYPMMREEEEQAIWTVLKVLNCFEKSNSSNVSDINVGTTEAISRQAALNALTEYGNGQAVYISVKEAVRRIEQLPPIQPVIVPCDYAKACNEATMDKLTSAVAYYDVLEELRKHGYVLVDMREVTT